MKIKLFGIVAALVAAFIVFAAFQQPQTNNPMINDDYKDSWKTIDSLESQGLPKSALELVKKLEQRALNDQNDPQIIKTSLYLAKYMLQLEENGLTVAVTKWKNHIANDQLKRLQPFFQSILASTYLNYAQANRWQMRDRTKIQGELPADFKTWSIENFLDEASRLYLASIEKPDLTAVDLENFDAILVNNNYDPALCPTLYDFLVNRAFEYFTDSQSFLTQFNRDFFFNAPEAFASIDEFVDWQIETNDESAVGYRALILFQQTLAKTKKGSPRQLYVNLKRLDFVHQEIVHPSKDDWYEAALIQLEKEYAESAQLDQILLKKAIHYQNKGNAYSNSNLKYQFKLKEARAVAKNALEQFPKSELAPAFRNIIRQVEQKSISTKVEQVVLPHQPILAQAEYRNVAKIYLRIVDINKEFEHMYLLNNRSDKDIQVLLDKKPFKQWSLDLPDNGDFQQHSVEFPIDGLPFGKYALLISDHPDFTFQNHTMGVVAFSVSEMAYWYNNTNNKPSVKVVHRETGESLQGVKVEAYERSYNRITRKTKLIRKQTGTTDENGLAELKSGDQGYYFFRLIRGNDDLMDENGGYHRNYVASEPKGTRQWMHFFMDRSIYRPGQTVYFKGMALEQDLVNEDIRLMQNREVVVSLFDVNNQEVAKVTLNTNEYGTVQGSFVLPSGGLKGQMSLNSSIGGSRHRFRVEEYKRPKFEVVFDELDGSYSLGDSVNITGKGLAFAGNNISGASYRYRVTRSVYYPWTYFRRIYYPSVGTVEIAMGSGQTDDNGQFEFAFEAAPEPSLPAEGRPAFNFRIEVEIIDVTGETHSRTKSISLAREGLLFDFPIKAEVDKSAVQEFPLQVTNLDQKPQDAVVQVEVYPLESPDRLLISRLWNKPDQYLMEKKDFVKKFPHLPFKNEDEPQNWAQGNKVFDQLINTSDIQSINFEWEDWQAGYYKIKLKTTDEKNREIVVERLVALYDSQKKEPIPQKVLFLGYNQQSLQPGENCQLFLGSSADANVFYAIGQNDKVLRENNLKVSNWKNLNFPVTEEHRGGFGAYAITTRFGRQYTERVQFSVPWSNKDLKLEWMSFRDKLKPGAEEEWRLKITGPKKEAIAAEMVATLYDASLDEIYDHDWNFSLYPNYYWFRNNWNEHTIDVRNAQFYAVDWQAEQEGFITRPTPRLNSFGFYVNSNPRVFSRSNRFEDAVLSGGTLELRSAPPPPMAKSAEMEADSAPAPQEELSGKVAGLNGTKSETAEEPSSDNKGETPPVQIRKNLKETVFFFPEMYSDKEGNIELRFTMNEALTRWKFLGFAHTQNLEFGFLRDEVITQKELMVQPNPPRFMREGDEVVFTAKVSNLTDSILTGNAQLELLNAITGEAVDHLFDLKEQNIPFSAEAGQAALVSWTLQVPQGEPMAIVHRVIAQTEQLADGEEDALPILSNRMLVTETMPMSISGNEKKTFSFDAMQKASASKTLKHHQFSLEFTSNPVWYAVRSLPYLMEYPYECTEQIFSRYYANSLATNIAQSYPKINQVFEQWKRADVLQSKLSQNQELKSVLLEETPWVLAAQSEEQQQKNIALLFDLNRMADEQQAALRKIGERQASNGGFSWFPGGRGNWYITQYLVEGMGRLKAMEIGDWNNNSKAYQIAEKAVGFIDIEIRDHYLELEKRAKDGKINMDDNHLNSLIIHYLYVRSFFSDIPMNKVKEYHAYYLAQAKKYWLQRSVYEQGLLAIALHRNKESETAKKIVVSLDERSIENEELGKYWKNEWGYFWYQLPVETQSLMVEVFAEVGQDPEAVEKIKIWLLKNKQTTHWKTTKATANAIYALLHHGENWLDETEQVRISFPELKAKQYIPQLKEAQASAEAGTGYFKTKWQEEAINQNFSKIKVDNPNANIAWGSAYWQYFEDLDQIKTFEETPLQIKKEVFIEVNTKQGPELQLLTDGTSIQSGDKLKVRIEIRVDRPMEYVHLKDMRASGLEPIESLSRYKWQDGLGYYESPGDVATHFFISYLPKGTYVFEYPLRAVHKGDFSNGITSMQCMYAPEFSSHSQGIRLKVE